MPALNFQKQFADDVESGKKRQTIRACRKDKRDPKPGDWLYLYTGMRTKQCRKLRTMRCVSVNPVVVEVGGIGPQIKVLAAPRLWRKFRRGDAGDSFAAEDGFESFEAMYEWFDKTYGLPFEGLLIRWGQQ